jgi:phosphate transport system protein
VNKHFQRDMHRLNLELLTMSGLVEEMIDKAVRTLHQHSLSLAREVIESDKEIDSREVHIEEECLKMLALHQPVATDLRRLTTVLKINRELEEIADLAENTATHAEMLAAFHDLPPVRRLEWMLGRASNMVRMSIDAYVRMSASEAEQVRRLDDEVDDELRGIVREIEEYFPQHPDLFDPLIHCFAAARDVERLADHARNIAKAIIYLIEGRIVRHSSRLAQETPGSSQ